MTRWQAQSNAETHGHAWAAQYLQSHGVCFTLAHWLLFGKAPRGKA